MGYKMFGESTMSQFTLNLPQDLVASKIAVWTTVTIMKVFIIEFRVSDLFFLICFLE